MKACHSFKFQVCPALVIAPIAATGSQIEETHLCGSVLCCAFGLREFPLGLASVGSDNLGILIVYFVIYQTMNGHGGGI